MARGAGSDAGSDDASVEQQVGRGNDPWAFVPATQCVCQSPTETALTSSQTLTVVYRANWIAKSSAGVTPRVDRLERRTDVSDPELGADYARESLALNRLPTETLTVAIDWRPSVPPSLAIGTTVLLSTGLASRARIRNPVADETWITTELKMTIRNPNGVYLTGTFMRRGFQRTFTEARG